MTNPKYFKRIKLLIYWNN